MTIIISFLFFRFKQNEEPRGSILGIKDCNIAGAPPPPHFHNKKVETDNEPDIISADSPKKETFKRKVKRTMRYYIDGMIFYSILRTGKIPFHYIRNFIYKYVFHINMGKNVIIYGGAEIRSPNKLIIGKGSIIGHYSILDARNVIEIGENVNFSHGVWLWTRQHNYNDPNFSSESPKNNKITIGDRAWLGPRVIVLPGCTIGEGAVIAAGAVVTKDIEPFTVNAGIPAKTIGERNRNLTYIFNEKPIPFV
jgi:acetyltransferase-like isoleucine patch superfamily enzyme